MRVAAQAHLGYDEFLVIHEYQVDLTELAPVIPFHKLEPPGTQTIERNLFGGPTFFRRARHALLPVDWRVDANSAGRDYNRAAPVKPRPCELPVNTPLFIGGE